MNAFSVNPPEWTTKAIHSTAFYCPTCQAKAKQAVSVWINRRSPVTDSNLKRKWQEFYLCECKAAWWSWNSDRPIAEEKIDDAI